MRKVLLTLVLLLGLTTVVRAEMFPDPGVSGDPVYDLRIGELGYGSGLDICGWKDNTILLRGELSRFGDNTKVGIGPGLDIAKAIRKSGGTWLPDNVASEIAALVALDITDSHINGDDWSIQGCMVGVEVKW